jgi:hypothetical protein
MPKVLIMLVIGTGISLAAFCVLVALFYMEEDWRGAHDWAQYRKHLVAKGEILNLRLLVSPGRPEDDLSKVPIFAEIYAYDSGPFDRNENKPRLDQVSDLLGTYKSSRPKSSDYLKGEPIDLSAWQSYFHTLPEAKLGPKTGTPADDVLHALSQLDPVMNEVNVALRNPNAFWPWNYERPLDTSIAPAVRLLRIAQVLALRATANLENHKFNSSFDDYLFSFDLNRSLLRHGSMICYLIQITDRKIDDQILWEGFRRHAWTVAQLRQMESKLIETDQLKAAVFSLRVERAEELPTFNLLQKPDKKTKESMENGLLGFSPSPSVYARPGGWWDQDRRQYALQKQTQIETIDSQEGSVNKLTEPTDAEFPNFWQSFYRPFSYKAEFYQGTIESNIAEAEARRRLALIACYLEEYYLAQGRYPDGLDSLPNLSHYLNQEVLTGRPLHYQRKGSGYSLYSTGWDETDHGGTPQAPGDNKNDYDWVWPSP